MPTSEFGAPRSDFHHNAQRIKLAVNRHLITTAATLVETAQPARQAAIDQHGWSQA